MTAKQQPAPAPKSDPKGLSPLPEGYDTLTYVTPEIDKRFPASRSRDRFAAK